MSVNCSQDFTDYKEVSHRELPASYVTRMRQMLGAEFPAYLDSLSENRVESLRVNTKKWTEAEAEAVLPWKLEPVPWEETGRYLPEEVRASRHPAYAAGLYYLQEASAMTPGGLLPLSPGDRVMDLCAAPGGKSTQLYARMRGGVLYSNDISASRARFLLKNLELAGAREIFVTAEAPEKLAERLGDSFQAVLVDAPCSGEGMFRRDGGMFHDWLERGPHYYVPLQASILDAAADLTAPGGYILYSTCTFSREENEDNITAFLERHQDFSLVPLDMRPGFSGGFLPGTVRLWPHKVRGEGHFVALLRRESKAINPEPAEKEPSPASLDFSKKKKRSKRSAPPGSGGSFMEKLSGFQKFSSLFANDRVICREEKLYALPPGETVVPGIRYLRTGLFLGECARNRFQPSQALAMAMDGSAFPDTVSFSWEDERILRYLRGETIAAEGADIRGEEGLVLVCVGRFPLGWGQRRGVQLKNKLLPNWRFL